MSDTNKFDADEQVQKVLKMMTGTRVAELKTGLNAACQLSQDARFYIAGKLEKKFHVVEVLSEAKRKEIRALAATIENSRTRGEPTEKLYGHFVNDLFAGALAFAFIFENRGERASPFVKAYAEEAAKLSDEEYYLPENHLKIVCTTVEKAQGINQPPAPKTNPFRPRPPGM